MTTFLTATPPSSGSRLIQMNFNEYPKDIYGGDKFIAKSGRVGILREGELNTKLNVLDTKCNMLLDGMQNFSVSLLW